MESFFELIILALMFFVYAGIFVFFAALIFAGLLTPLKVIRKSFLIKNFQIESIKRLQKFIIENKIINRVLGIWNGEGTQTLGSGRKYVGEFKNGLWNGHGELTSSADGRSYVGGFKDGVFHGKGTAIDIYGNKTVAEFKDGKTTFAEIFYKNGSKYVGEFNDGIINGQGTFSFGQGTFSFKDGKKFVGEFKDKIPWEGQIFDKNGELIDKVEYGKISKNIEDKNLINLAKKVSESKSPRELFDEVRKFEKTLNN